MAEIKTTLKEAIAKAIDEERDIANRLANAVLERPQDDVAPALGWAEEVVQQVSALQAKQHVVDILKSALSRLPDTAQTY